MPRRSNPIKLNPPSLRNTSLTGKYNSFAKQTVNSLPSCLPALRKSFAFTLAETLITLGIIGIVAAMTLPSVITKFQQRTFSTSFKKQYSVLNDTLNYLILNDSISECYLEVNPSYRAKSSDCAALKKGLVDKLKLTKIQNNFSNLYANSETIAKEGGVSGGTNPKNLFSVKTNTYMLPDGAILIFSDTGAYTTSYLNVFFILDTNGKKGPNKWGYDTFLLVFAKHKDKIRITDEFALASEKGGSLPRNILLNKWGNDYKNKGYAQWD